MFNFNFKSILLIILTVFLLVSSVLLSISAFNLANSKAFEWDKNNVNLAKTKGDETTKFWETQKLRIGIPVVINIFGVVLTSLIFYLR